METSKEAISKIDEGLQSFTGKAKDLFGEFKGKIQNLSDQARSKIAGTAATTGGSKRRSVKGKKTKGKGKGRGKGKGKTKVKAKVKGRGKGKKTRGKTSKRYY